MPEAQALDKFGIYKIVNTTTNRIYIGGTTVSFSKRWKMHGGHLRNGIHVNTELQRDWDLLGEPSFLFEILEIVERRGDVCEREQYWIDKYSKDMNESIYNVILSVAPYQSNGFILKNFLVDEIDFQKIREKMPMGSEGMLFRACIKAALDLSDEALMNYCLQSIAKPGPKAEKT